MNVKKSMRTLLAAILALALLTGGFACLAEAQSDAAEAGEKKAIPTVEVERDPEHLTVANTTAMAGDFFAGMWSGGTADADVRVLLHGYDLVRWNGEDGAFELDPSVVSGVAVSDDDEGNRTYTLALYDDLLFSDGSQVTAWDYAFSMLLRMSGEIDRLGGTAQKPEYLLGYEEYVQDSAPLLHTEVVRVEEESAINEVVLAQDSYSAERVLQARVPGEDGGEARLVDFEDLLDEFSLSGEITLARDPDGCLSLPAGGIELDDGEGIRVDAAGVIQNWRYENGVRMFEDGSHPRLTGVHVASDDTLQITIFHEYLPYFYELSLLSCVPYPSSAIAPGVMVRDDGEGVYLANIPVEDDVINAPVFTAELLEQTLLDPENGYVSHPSVVSGPYLLTDFDGMTAEFERNSNYKGDAQGDLPAIERLTYTLADNGTMVERLATGEYDLINKVTQAETINAAMTLLREGEFTRTEATLPEESADASETTGVGVDEAKGELWRSEERFRMSNYPRTGLSFVSFRCERPGVNSAAVRQAIAWCMDRSAIAREYTGGFGMRADGYYGMGQWMVDFVTGTAPYPVEEPEDPEDAAQTAAYEEALAQWEALNLDNLTIYEKNLDKARELLASEGWRAGEDGILEKDGERLDLVLIYPEGNAIGEIFREGMAKDLQEVGIALTLAPVPSSELMARYHRQLDGPVALPDGEAREADMIYLATNFDVAYDPAETFAVDEKETGVGPTGLADRKLYDLALDMRHTEAGDLLSYMKKWVAFQERFNELLPMIPVYTNVYFDFYSGELTDYDIDRAVAWSEAILDARIDGQTEDIKKTEVGDPETASTEEPDATDAPEA